MEGFLGKRGKRMGSRVKRYMRLEGTILSNHHTAGEQPTWRVDIKDAIITCNPKKSRLVLELFSNKLELFAESSRECEQWYDALKAAQSKANIQPTPLRNEDGSSSTSQDQVRIVSLASDSLQEKDANQRTQLSKNFKVVKPQPTLRSDDSSGGSDDVYEGEKLVVQGQVYEETPASMIFKQFNFPAK